MIVTATKHDFNEVNGSVCEQGATFHNEFVWENRDGTIIDLSLYTGKMQVRKNYGGVLIVEFNTSDNSLVLDSSGRITLKLSSAVTRTLPPGKYKYDLELYGPSDDVRLIEGEFVISGEVTI